MPILLYLIYNKNSPAAGAQSNALCAIQVALALCNFLWIKEGLYVFIIQNIGPMKKSQRIAIFGLLGFLICIILGFFIFMAIMTHLMLKQNPMPEIFHKPQVYTNKNLNKQLLKSDLGIDIICDIRTCNNEELIITGQTGAIIFDSSMQIKNKIKFDLKKMGITNYPLKCIPIGIIGGNYIFFYNDVCSFGFFDEKNTMIWSQKNFLITSIIEDIDSDGKTECLMQYNDYTQSPDRASRILIYKDNKVKVIAMLPLFYLISEAIDMDGDGLDELILNNPDSGQDKYYSFGLFSNGAVSDRLRKLNISKVGFKLKLSVDGQWYFSEVGKGCLNLYDIKGSFTKKLKTPYIGSTLNQSFPGELNRYALGKFVKSGSEYLSLSLNGGHYNRSMLYIYG